MWCRMAWFSVCVVLCGGSCAEGRSCPCSVHPHVCGERLVTLKCGDAVHICACRRIASHTHHTTPSPIGALEPSTGAETTTTTSSTPTGAPFALPCRSLAGRDPLTAEEKQIVDEHALKPLPPGTDATVEALTQALTAPFDRDAQKFRAIHRWIADNISYDVAALQTGDHSMNHPEGVLQRRAAVCSGYAGLAMAMAKAAGIKGVQHVSGWAKGYGHKVGSKLQDRKKHKPDHAWIRASFADASGEAQELLFDPTWASGSLSGAQFEKHYCESYWCSDPLAFVYTHLPKEPADQLLSPPLEAELFYDLAILKSQFFSNGLKVVSTGMAKVPCGDEGYVVVSAPESVALSVRLAAEDTPRKVRCISVCLRASPSLLRN